jgi:hypothetical protein
MDDNNYAIRILLVICAVAVLVLLILQFNKKMTEKSTISEEKSFKEKPFIENYENVKIVENNQDNKGAQMQFMPSREPVEIKNTSSNEVMASEPLSNEDYKAVDYDTSKNNMPSQCYPRDKLTAEDLLPKDSANNKWSEANPAGQGDVGDRNFLSAGFHIGTDTIGQSLRNANYQLRSDPPNPKLKVGPWNQSTIEFDQSRKHFEINDC